MTHHSISQSTGQRCGITRISVVRSLPVLRIGCQIPCPEVRLKAGPAWVSHKLIPINRNFSDHEKNREGKSGEAIRKNPSDGSRKWIELCATELNKFITAGEACIQKCKCIPF